MDENYENDYYNLCEHESCLEQAWFNPFELTSCERQQKQLEAIRLTTSYRSNQISYEEYALQMSNRSLYSFEHFV
jgi:hypothetical protein